MDRETALKLSKEFKVHYLQLLREGDLWVLTPSRPESG